MPDDTLRPMKSTLSLAGGIALLVLYAAITLPSVYSISGEGRIRSGLDPSWKWGLNLFHDRSFQFGRDVIFTYGPLGYLQRPLAPESHLAQGFALYAIVQAFIVALGCFFLVRTRRVIPLLLFVLGLFGLAVCNPEPDQPLVAILLLAATLSAELRSRALAYCCFVFAAPLLLMKFSSGLSGAAIALVLGLLWRWRYRSWDVSLAGGGLYGLTLFVCTCLFLGGPEGFFPFWQGSTEIATGYNAAMFNGGPHSEIFAAIGALAFLFGGLSWFGLRGSRFACLLFLAAFPSVLAFKHSFTRHDVGHIPFVFEIVLLALSIALLFSSSLIERAWGLSAYAVTLAAFLLCIGPEKRQQMHERVWNLIEGRVMQRGLDTVFHWHREVRNTETAFHRALAADRLPADMTSVLGTDPVMVLPWEIAICAANHVSCVPYPTLQMYSTYTTALDRWTANRIRGYRKLYIVAELGAIDGRQMLWDCPITWRTILEGWKVERVSGPPERHFVLLKERDDALPSADVPLGETDANLGAWVPLPDRSPWLRAHLHLRERWIGRLRRVLFRPRATVAEIRRASGTVESFRLVIDTARDGIWIGSAPRTAEDLVRWFEGTVAADPVTALRISGPASPDLQPSYHIRWSTSRAANR